MAAGQHAPEQEHAPNEIKPPSCGWIPTKNTIKRCDLTGVLLRDEQEGTHLHASFCIDGCGVGSGGSRQYPWTTKFVSFDAQAPGTASDLGTFPAD